VEALMPSAAERIVIIGGGHNGLVAACYLAKGGFAPLVLERRALIGGIGITEEFHPGFRCSPLMPMAGPLPARLNTDFELQKFGLQLVKPDVQLVALHPDGPGLNVYEDPLRTAAGLAKVSTRDATKYPEFLACLDRLGGLLAPYVFSAPPDIDNLTIQDFLNFGKAGRNFRRLGQRDAYRLLRWAPMPVADLASEWFENDLLRAVFAARGIFGSLAGPRSAGTSAALLLESALGGRGSFVRGGTGAFTEALAKAATAAGAEIRRNANVTHIQVKNGKSASVVLESGEVIPTKIVVSNADPRRTFLELVDATDLDPSFLGRVRAYRSIGAVGKVNFALSGIPAFSAIPNSGELHPRIHVAPDMDYLDRAYDAAKYGDLSPSPYMDITIPSLVDSSLAPKGCHVMSVHVQYAPYRLKNGDWNTRRDELADAVVNTLAVYAPNIRDLILHRQVLTPLDMERVFALSGGHMFHGEHALDQLFTFRPFLGWARYRTPIKGLYLCGAGTHPGGGLTGAPGLNASREIIKDLKARK
jgi:phytoene dehydrogenase-like protein